MQPCGVWKINPDQIYVVIFRKLRYNVYKVDIIPAHEAVSAFTAESRCASNCHVRRTWYNVYKVDIIPAHEAVSAFTAESRCASNCYARRTWYNVYKVDIIPAHTGF